MGRFISNYKKRAGFNLCHGIGQDKECCWAAYWKGLTEVGYQGFDVDYSNYDGSVPQCAVDAFTAVLNHAYSDDRNASRTALVQAIVQSVIIVGDQVVEKQIGNCSGSPITDVMNSVTNWYHVLCAYLITRSSADLPVDLNSFDEDVRALTYGDDLIVSAKDSVLDWFNRESFAAYASILGMKVTSAAKTAGMIAYEPLGQLTFLKSPFVNRGSYFAAPLPKKVIYREVMWQKKCNVGDLGIFRQKIDMALMMMAHHGKDELKKFTDELCALGVDAQFNFQAWEREMREKQEYYRVDGPATGESIDAFFTHLPADIDAFDWDPDFDY